MLKLIAFITLNFEIDQFSKLSQDTTIPVSQHAMDRTIQKLSVGLGLQFSLEASALVLPFKLQPHQHS